jgi:hypothetical protein
MKTRGKSLRSPINSEIEKYDDEVTFAILFDYERFK